MKSLGDPLRQIPVFAGATILGDGRVALILDVPGLARHAGITVRGHAAIEALDDAPPPPVVATETVILCRAGGFHVAIPQSDIARLEEFPRAMVERLGERRVVQYRGGLLPLVPLSGLLGPRAPGAPGRTSRTSAPTRTARRPARRRSEPSASSWWALGPGHRARGGGDRRNPGRTGRARGLPARGHPWLRRHPRARDHASSISRRCWCRRARARRLRAAPRRDGRLRRAMAGERMLCVPRGGPLPRARRGHRAGSAPRAGGDAPAARLGRGAGNHQPTWAHRPAVDLRRCLDLEPAPAGLGPARSSCALRRRR